MLYSVKIPTHIYQVVVIYQAQLRRPNENGKQF